MIDSRHIQDDFGNSIPMLDAYGNLSVQVIMLYADDKLTETDRKAVDDFAATDEMSRDALDGYAMLPQTSQTRLILGNLNAEIQKATGSTALPIQMDSKAPFNYRRLAAAITLLVVIGGGTFWASTFFSSEELAEGINFVNSEDSTVADRKADSTSIGIPTKSETAEESGLASNRSEKITKLEEPTDERSKLSGNAESTSVKQLEKIPVTVGTTGVENKSLDAVKTANPNVKDADRAGDIAAKTKSISADANLAQEKQSQTKATTSAQIENQKNSEKKAKETLTKEAESRATAGRMREESQKAQSEKYDSAYEPSASPAAAQQISTNSDLSAKFPGGDAALSKFIEKKKTYPETLREQKVSGTISVWFDIETDGKVTNARIKTGENGVLTEDALRVVRSMPNWKAALNEEGQPIKSSRTVVIKYGPE
jgi:TonB family protein